MRRPIFPTLAMLGVALLTACSQPRPPIGRWEGVYEDSSLLILARLEIKTDGSVRVSAPNAIADKRDLSDDERQDLKEKLAVSLAEGWPLVAPIPFDFDGKAFRKPGGVAPQLEWDSRARRMTLVFYSGRTSVRVPLASVQNFGETPS